MSGLDSMQVQRHAPIREQVAAILRDAIVDQRLAPGQLLIERELCELTLASRPSVREALRILEAEGLVESQNGRGTYVSVVSPAVARHVYAVRVELEGLAAQLFAEQADEPTRARLRAAVLEVSRIADSTAPDTESRVAMMLAAKNQVYEVLFTGSGNPILHDMIGMLQRRVTQLRALTLAQPGRPEQSAREIESLLAAIDRHDGRVAREVASQHVRNAATIVMSVLDES